MRSINVDRVPGDRAVLPAIQSVNASYVLRAQLEVVNIRIARHADCVCGLWQGSEAKKSKR